MQFIFDDAELRLLRAALRHMETTENFFDEVATVGTDLGACLGVQVHARPTLAEITRLCRRLGVYEVPDIDGDLLEPHAG